MIETFLVKNGIIFVSLKFLFFFFLVMLVIGTYMRGLKKIIKKIDKSRKKMSYASAILSAIIDTTFFPIYVMFETIGDIFFMWRR